MGIKLLNNLVAVRRNDKVDTSSGGIILTETDKESKGIVAAVGPGMYTSEGKFVETTVQVGDEIIFHKETGNTVEIDGEPLLIMSEVNVIGILK